MAENLYGFNEIKLILKIIRFILYPIKILIDIIYGSNAPRIIGYSWYSKSEYDKMVKTAKDEDIITDYYEWKENAEGIIASFRSTYQGWLILKVHINSAELNNWLSRNKLTNIQENRQLFMGAKISKFTEDPSIY